MGGIQSTTIDHIKIAQNNNADPPTKLSSESQCDWSDLTQDIIRLTSTKFASLNDVIHFRGVCKNWFSAISLPAPLPRPPWIFLDDDCIPKTLNFLSLDRFDFCKDLPEVENMQLVGTTYNSMVLLDENKNAMYLVNPITGKINPLPPFAENYPRAHHIDVDPIRGSNTIIIRLKLSNKLLLLICQLGDQEWKIVQVPFLDYGCAYFNGFYYIYKGTTLVIELSTGITVASLSHPLEIPSDQRLSYLIESFGELIGIWKNKLWCSSVKEYRFEVFRLKNENGSVANNKWVKINNIEHKILFLNSTTGFCFRANDFPGFKENSIYFVSAKCLPGPVGPRDESFNLCRYDIKNSKTEELKPIDSILAYWFFPSLQ